MFNMITDTAMLSWLRTQVRILEAWREEVATRTDLDIPMIQRLEDHYQWLTAEVAYLESRAPQGVRAYA